MKDKEDSEKQNGLTFLPIDSFSKYDEFIKCPVNIIDVINYVDKSNGFSKLNPISREFRIW